MRDARRGREVRADAAGRTYVFGISGRVGRLLTETLRSEGMEVGGLVRDPSHARALGPLGVCADVGELGELEIPQLAALLAGTDVVVYAAGSNGGRRRATALIDRSGLERVCEAAVVAGVRRLILLSVMPEAWRERVLSDHEEYYFAAKKAAEVALVRTPLQWTILRPSLLTDEPPSGAIALSPAEAHGSIARADVAAVLAAVVQEPRLGRRILELNEGGQPIAEAVAAAVASAYG